MNGSLTLARAQSADACPSMPASWSARFTRAALQSMILAISNAIVEIEVSGRENLDNLQLPALFIANHSSHLDTPMLFSVLPRSCRNRLAVAAAQDYFFSRPALAWLVRSAFNAFPVERKRGLSTTLAACEALRQQGYSILLFPEGTRSQTGQIGRFKRGVGLLAIQLGLPVVPIRLDGVFELMPKGSVLPRRGRAIIRVGEPLVLEPGLSYSEATLRIREAVDS